MKYTTAIECLPIYIIYPEEGSDSVGIKAQDTASVEQIIHQFISHPSAIDWTSLSNNA